MEHLYVDFDSIVKRILNNIASGVREQKQIFNKNIFNYIIEETKNKKIYVQSVSGFVNQKNYRFEYGKDYTIDGNRIEWILNNNADSVRPDDGSLFTIIYTVDMPLRPTDQYVGSVTRTFVEIIAHEIKNIHNKIEEVYNSGFITTAKGEALDELVKLMNLERRPPTKASGEVIFFRRDDLPEIENTEVFLYDGRTIYELKNKIIKDVKSVIGFFENKEHEFTNNIDYLVDKNSSTKETIIKWNEDGKRPDPDREFMVTYISHEAVIIPKATKVSTSPTQYKDEIVFLTDDDTLLTEVYSKNWEARTTVTCEKPGIAGNVLAGEIRNMPNPIPWVEGVINTSGTYGGREKENDDSLRERAKRSFDFRGKSTINSLKSSIESLEGVKQVIIIDRFEGVKGLVKIIVDGGKDEEIYQTVEKTRAAGIKTEIERPMKIMLEILSVIYIHDVASTYEKNLKHKIENEIQKHIDDLGIGKKLIINKLISDILQVDRDNLLDVEKMEIDMFFPKQADKILSSQASIEGAPNLGDKTAKIYSEKKTFHRENIDIKPNNILRIRKIDIIFQRSS